MRYQNPELGDLLAAEYVLGTLKGQARRRFEKLLPGHPSLRQRVQDWDLRLNQLADSAPPVAPPAAAFDALQQRLFPEPPRPPWYERLGLWRGLAVGSSALAGILAAVLLTILPQQAQQTPGYVVMLSSTETQKPAWLVNASHDLGQLQVKSLKRMDMPKDIRCILWLQPEGSDQVYSLGILPDQGDEKMLDVAGDKRNMMPGQLLVTIENVSGGTPQKPSTPPAYVGEWMPLKI